MASLIFSLQALLTRHEAYIHDSEQERKAMAAQIQSLEVEKQVLERRNANTIEENRTLLDQLESLNSAVAESDTQVTNLQSTLRSTQQELHKLSYLQSRTEKLEQQLADFEREQATWQYALEEKDESAKSALRRWQEAQRTLASLQEQMERIEQEAKEEKERHVEVLGRMERQHIVEKELDSAAGRLKGAAAAKTAGNGNVVSHFVKDILQDNANLQMGIVELRDMLHSSNEEVETLRNQLSVHQPVVTGAEIVQPTSSPIRPHLKEEMRAATSQELHVHHHYHAPSTPKTPLVRRPKKKRYGSLTPSSGMSTPRHSFSTPSNTAAILSQTAATLPGGGSGQNSNRWSYMSDRSFMSAQSVQSFSGPSSPQSTNRASSMFDRVFSDAGQDSSRPTTPDTEDPGSPMFAPLGMKRITSAPMHSQRPSISSHRGRPSLDSILDISSENLRELEPQLAPEGAIPEEDELDWETSDSPPGDDLVDATSPLSEEITQALERPRNLRRAASHESILSCRGMDIHTLRSRPSQLLTPYGGRSYTPQAVISDATAHAAVSASMSRPMDSGHRLLSGMAPAALQRQASSNKQGLGSRVGGWMFGKWGASPMPTVTVTDAAATAVSAPKMNRTASIASGSTNKSTNDPDLTPKKPKLRPPGINQMGPIPGFGPEIKIHHPPIMKSLDQTALESVLGDI